MVISSIIALNYEMDTYADDNHRGLKGGVTGSSDATTLVSAKTFGQHNGSVKVGADFVLTKDFMFNLNDNSNHFASNLSGTSLRGP